MYAVPTVTHESPTHESPRLRPADETWPDNVELPADVDRRTFAVPTTRWMYDDDEWGDLDPSDPDNRSLLIRAEHPEYEDVLDSDDLVDGVNPRLHVVAHEIVANQLWDDDPPETWRAAQRLLAQGYDRHEIFHRLGEVVMTRVYEVMTHDRPSGRDSIRAAMDAVGRAPAGTQVSGVYQLNVSLEYITPPIWRRIRVPAGISLSDLHDVIQVAMGWDDSHLHEFTAHRISYQADPDPESHARDERTVTLAEVAKRKGSKLSYTYDFGDDWRHEIRVEETNRKADSPAYAECVDGERACPPEDCGGLWGYAGILEALADPDNEEHAERLEWLGDGYAPDAFDLTAVNQTLRRMRLRSLDASR